MRFTDFIADVVDNIRQRVTATAFTDNGDGTFTVSVPGLMDLEAGSFVIIDGTEYKVISIDSNNSTFDIEATAAPGDYVVKCAHPYYLHGTALAVDAELRQTFNGWKKYPLVFLNESINRREDASETAQVRETYSARLFFCALGDYENMLTEDFYDEIIDPLNVYVDNFITTLKFSGSVFWKQVGTFDRIDHPKWGLEIVDKGKTTNIFNDKLSAVELVMDIPMSRAWSPCKYRKPELRFTSCRTINPTYVTVNGDAFEEAANGGTIDVVVRYDTLGPIGTIVGNEVIIPDPGFSADATVTVNGSAWGTIPSGDTGNIPVRNTAGTQVGSKVGPDWVVPDGVVNIVDTASNPLFTNSVESGVTESRIIPDSQISINSVVFASVLSTGSLNIPVVNDGLVAVGAEYIPGKWVINPCYIHNSDDSFELYLPAEQTYLLGNITAIARNSALTTVASQSVPAVRNVTLDIGDSIVSNSDDSYSVSVPAEVNHELPDVTITVENSENTVLVSDVIPSVKNHLASLADIDFTFPLTDLVQIAAGKDITITTNLVEYNTAGSSTYTPPANLLYAHVCCIGGGGGGGSGRKGAAGTNRSGGAGASAGTLARKLVKKSEIGASVTVTVGAGGTGGAAQTTNSTNGNSGTAGGDSSFGSLVVAKSGNGGGGGTTATVTGGTGVSVSAMTPNYSEWSIPSIVGGSSGTGTGSAGTVIAFGIPGAGGGGGINTSNAQGNGAAGSQIRKNDGTTNTAAAAGNATTPTPAGNGLDNQLTNITPVYPTLNTIGLGTSGGGGYGNLANSGSENWGGGNGGLYGGAGGGGGAGVDSTTDSGKGGDGARGCVIIIEFLIS